MAMDSTSLAVLALVLLPAVIILMRTVTVVRRIGNHRLANALAILFAGAASAVKRLLARGAGRSAASRKPLDLSGTGGHYNARTGNYDSGQDPYGVYPDNDRL